MKRLLLFICTLLCANVLMAQLFWEGSLRYEVTGAGKVRVHLCHPSATSVNIPSIVTHTWDHYDEEEDEMITDSIITYNVTAIGYSAFYICSSLTSITIPNSVTSIGEWAFGHCSSLTSITIPNSVTSIGDCAFYNCSSLTSVTIPNSITSIGNYTFWNCSSLTSVTIPNSITSIGREAFYYCTSLESINLSDNITSIGRNCFDSCINLTTVNIPTSLSVIDTSLFRYCTSLTSITIPENITDIKAWSFWNCHSLTSINIPNSVNSIGEQAFAYCNTLSSVTLGNSVTSIGYATFYQCSNLSSINFPNSLISIGDYAFDYCSSLTSIDIPNSVTFIGDYAFAVCNTLSSVTLGNSVTSIGYATFYNCSGLTSIDIPNSVTSIGDYAFLNCTGLESINLSDNITSIGRNCFDSCINLTTVNIPISLSVIDTSLFRNCTSLNSVTIPENITDIKAYAFANCNNLTSVNIGNSVNSIGYGAFAVCNTLSSVTCLANTPPSLGDYVFYNTPSNKILNVNCGLKDDYISSWGNAFDSNNIFEMYQYNVVATVNNEEFGSVAVENNCSTATLSATANSGYSFLNWNDGNTENPRVVSLTSDTSFVANFIISTVNTDITATICQGQTYTENGFNVSEAGVYTQTLTAINGADSIVTLTLNVNPIFNTELTATICEGSVYTENNFNVSEAGVYTQTLTSVNGCDSVVTLTLNVNPIFNTELVATICQGQVYNEQGFNVSEAGTYTQTLQTVNGCDSIVTLTLNVNPIFNTELSATICEGQVYNEQGFNVNEAGVYTQTLTSANGCDSIVTLTLNVNPTFDTTITATINAGEMYSEFGFNESEAGTYVQNLQTVNGCDSTITLILDVNSSLMDVEHSELSFYPNPTSGIITFNRSDIMKVEVLDAMGRTLEVYENAYTIDISKLAKGYYAMRVTTAEGVAVRKVIHK